MLSRVANSIFWMNRYIERAENYARFVSVNFNLALDLPPTVSEQWKPLIVATADHFTFEEYYDAVTRERVLDFMTFDTRNHNSIISCLQFARENARTIRESISKEMWEHGNGLYWKVKDAAAVSDGWELSQFQSFYNEIKMGCEMFFAFPSIRHMYCEKVGEQLLLVVPKMNERHKKPAWQGWKLPADCELIKVSEYHKLKEDHEDATSKRPAAKRARAQKA